MTEPALRIVRADYADPVHAAALVELLDHYAQTREGGGAPLSDFARTHIVEALATRPIAFSVLAFEDELAVGLVNAIEGFSTFACQPLVNIHDVVVRGSHRGRGIGSAMLARVEALARERGACKLTLEVLSANHAARGLYAKLGFDDYRLDPDMGDARFMQKWLD